MFLSTVELIVAIHLPPSAEFDVYFGVETCQVRKLHHALRVGVNLVGIQACSANRENVWTSSRKLALEDGSVLASWMMKLVAGYSSVITAWNHATIAE